MALKVARFIRTSKVVKLCAALLCGTIRQRFKKDRSTVNKKLHLTRLCDVNKFIKENSILTFQKSLWLNYRPHKSKSNLFQHFSNHQIYSSYIFTLWVFELLIKGIFNKTIFWTENKFPTSLRILIHFHQIRIKRVVFQTKRLRFVSAVKLDLRVQMKFAAFLSIKCQ